MAPEESPGLLDAALRSLHHELSLIESKSAYNLAQEMHNAASSANGGQSQCAMVNTDDFRLRFLRCEIFDTKKAALRMVKYLELVRENFGNELLTRPMKLSDFSREEMSFLRGGDYQLLPYRDRSGRRILCIVTNNRDDISASIRLKVLFYLWVVAANDVESQRKGMIVVSYSGPKIVTINENNRTKQSKFHQSRVTTHVVVASTVPMRPAAIHFCMPDKPIFQLLSQIYGMALGNWNARVKFHLGESVELRYQLKGYGIPVELIPSTDTGNVKHVNLKQWIKLREYLEKRPSINMEGAASSDSEDAMDYEYTNSTIPHQYYPQQQYQLQQKQQQQQPRMNIVECPGSNDVIFRRGKSMTYHPGNVMFQSLIESRLEEHNLANQAGKLSIVLSLIQYIEQVKGGRFLTWDSKNNWWVEMMTIPVSGSRGNSSFGMSFQAQELEIQSKVNYAFRDFKKKMRTQQNLQVSRSSTYVFERQDGYKKKRTRGDSEASCVDGCKGYFGATNDSDHVVSDGD